jgi:hypothetical protein
MNTMSERTLPELPENLEEFLDIPYGGLFGDSALAQIVEEIVADPTMYYRPKYLEELTGRKPKTVRYALQRLAQLGLIENVSKDSHHPVYRVVVESKKFIALSLLAYALLDDRDKTRCMDTAILDYYHKNLENQDKPLARATASPEMWGITAEPESHKHGFVVAEGV